MRPLRWAIVACLLLIPTEVTAGVSVHVRWSCQWHCCHPSRYLLTQQVWYAVPDGQSLSAYACSYDSYWGQQPRRFWRVEPSPAGRHRRPTRRCR